MRNYFFALCSITHLAWCMEELTQQNGKKENIVGAQTALLFPTITASSENLAFFDDYKNCKQYLGTLDNPQQISLKKRLYVHEVACNPTFSPNGDVLIGWTKKPFMREQFCCITTYFGALTQRIKWSEYRRKGWLHYAFLPNGMLIFRDNMSLYECTIKDLVEYGEAALIKIHTRSDTKEYPFISDYKPFHAFSNSIISCIGPDEKNFEILEKGTSSWSKSHTVKTAHRIRRVIYAPSCMRVATSEEGNFYRLHFYQLDSHSSSLGAIDIESLLYPSVVAFSPDGQHLACGTTKDRGEIDIVDCSDLTKPFICATLSIAPGLPVTRIIWYSTTMYVQDGHTNRYDIDASLVIGYKDKKLAKEESNNNNA